MPALPVIADTYRVALNWLSSTGQIAANVIHIRTRASGHTAGDVMENLDDNAGSNLWLSCSSSAVVKDVAITPLDGSSATVHFSPASPGAWTGGQAGDFSPATSAIVKLTTSLRGRSHRGRIFLPFTGESVMSDGVLDSTTAASMNTEWTAFAGVIGADADTPMDIVVASYKLAQANIVDFFNVEGLLATQRRRQGRLRGQ